MSDLRTNAFAVFAALAMSGPAHADEAALGWMIVVRRVEHVALWHEVFDRALSIRRGGGEFDHRITADQGDPNLLTVVMAWESLERALGFAGDPVLTNGMRAACVEEPVQIWVCSAETIPSLAGLSGACERMVTAHQH